MTYVSQAWAMSLLKAYLGPMIELQSKDKTGSGMVCLHVVSKYNGWKPEILVSVTEANWFIVLRKVIPGIFAQGVSTSEYFTESYRRELERRRISEKPLQTIVQRCTPKSGY